MTNKKEMPEGTVPEYLGLLIARLPDWQNAIVTIKSKKTVCIPVSPEAGVLPGAPPANGSACKTTVTEQYCQFIDDTHGGHWVCYDYQKELSGTYDAEHGCCQCVDPDNGGQYCSE